MNETTITARPDTPFIEVVREFDAPRGRVFRAWTDPEIVPQWLGPRGMTMKVVEFTATPGGGYRYIHADDTGEYAFRGVFHNVVQDELIIQTFEYEGAPNDVCLETMTFEDLGDGRTRVHGRSVYSTVEARDAMVASGMEHGMRESMERLDEVLAR
ncbi:SRPBCC family protein [Actinokineospora sp. UTMC 2448]|uniref:SRPBCC family protein n=1 Tax=Actinokineospora sp. UTMC 2448 TaxID=2268449 RepID=UPI0021646606|nr:SRPBCC family protein [Actinokineospora sp. UTMC 2448]UVS79734.1 Activator of Hsp90 ATPase [Actinokineospora sp. UTMC 2448]